MPSFSQKSKDRLSTCNNDLRKILNIAIQVYDFTVACGYRNKTEQTEAYKSGTSKLQWPNSRHNGVPSDAVDIYPYKNGNMVLDDNSPEWEKLSLVVRGIAKALNIEIENGYDIWGWDKPHWQLKKE